MTPCALISRRARLDSQYCASVRQSRRHQSPLSLSSQTSSLNSHDAQRHGIFETDCAGVLSQAQIANRALGRENRAFDAGLSCLFAAGCSWVFHAVSPSKNPLSWMVVRMCPLVLADDECLGVCATHRTVPYRNRNRDAPCHAYRASGGKTVDKCA